MRRCQRDHAAERAADRAAHPRSEVGGLDEAREAVREVARKHRNATRRARDQARRDLGLVRTPYGWE